MAQLALLTNARGTSVEVLPALELLSHRVRVLAADAKSANELPDADVVLLDARTELVPMRKLAQLIARLHPNVPLLGVFTDGGLAAVTPEWGLRDFVLAGASPTELEARIRLAQSSSLEAAQERPTISVGELVIDEDAYVARVDGDPLNLTYKEFELLKYLAANSGHVLSRAQLLHEVWGYDYFGGTRTVDVHIRRLRAKLGSEYEAMITTVRNVGYGFSAVRHTSAGRGSDDSN